MKNIDSKKILNALNNHGVIAFPTETVMGLGVIYDDFLAYQKLNKIKNREENKPYTLMLKNVDEIEKFALLNSRDKLIINKFMPGALTILVKAKDNIPGYVTHNSGIIGIRVPNFDVTLEILNIANKPLLVPSANKSGEKPCLTYQEVNEVFKDEIDYLVQIDSNKSVASTIVDLTQDDIKLIREGSIKFIDIKEAIKHGN
ncbi:MAG: L-threonylcarbamoyladenylate synthase [Bacilli bacterium]